MTKILNRAFGSLTLLIALVNIFRGNDPGFGIFLLLLALLYIPPTEKLYQRYLDFFLSNKMKIITAIVILRASLGVGELLEKIAMMVQSFK